MSSTQKILEKFKDDLPKMQSALNRRFTFDQLREDMKQYKLFENYAQRISDLYTPLYSMNPEEVYLEKENNKEILECIANLKMLLTPNKFELLCEYILEEKTHKEIAKENGVTRQSITARLKTIEKNVKKIQEEFPQYHTESIKPLLTPKPSVREAETPTPMGWPHEFLQKVSDGSREGLRFGRKVFISKTKCKVPSLFKQEYNGEPCWCSLCMDDFGNSKCTNMRKEDEGHE